MTSVYFFLSFYAAKKTNRRFALFVAPGRNILACVFILFPMTFTPQFSWFSASLSAVQSCSAYLVTMSSSVGKTLEI